MGGFKRAYLWGVEMKYEITKGSEKDFEGAPAWAMQVFQNKSCKANIWFVEGNAEGGRWINHCGTMKGKVSDKLIDPSNELIAERRLFTNPIWDGEGLMPSVGMKCLAKQCSQINADEFLVVAIQDGAVFGFWTSTGAATGLDVNRWIFLPIRSPENVAREKERSEECDKIFGILSGVERTGNRSDMAEALYDAGYRKME